MRVDREHLRLSYDAHASKRAVFPLPEWRIQSRDDWIASTVQAGSDSVIDLGGGPGVDGQAFREAGLDVIVVDLSPRHVEIARDAGLNAVVGDLVDTGLPDQCVGAAWSASAFMHLGDGEFEDALGEVARLVTPGGPVRIGLWGGVDEEVVWTDDFQDPPRTFVHRSDDRVRRLVAEVLDDMRFWTEQAGFRPDLHYQWIDARTHVIR